jgi:O-antigen/teichoic acid export membrane protein
MLPGLFCLGLGQFSVNAVFQIARKTLPLVIAALVVCIADPLIFLALPRAGVSSLAIAQSLAMAAGLVTLLVFAQANKAQWPPLRDLAWTTFAALGMAGVAGVWRDYHPGLPQMAGQMVLAGSFYFVVVGLFDVARLRTAVLAKAEPALQRAGILKKPLPLSIE